MSSVEESIAFVLDSSRAHPVGLAFLVSDRLMLTCAHVVNASLGRSLREIAPVPDGVRIPLDFALLGSSDDWFDLSARIVAWLPDRRPLDLDQDVAVLRLGQDLSRVGATPLKIWTGPAGSRMSDVQMWGTWAGERRGRQVLGRLMGPVGKHRLQVDEHTRGMPRVGRGFSGGPAWYPASGEVVGMLQAISSDDESAEVFILAGTVLEQAIASTMPRKAGLVLAHDHGEVHYDGTTYSLRQSRLIHNHSSITLASYEMKVSVNHSLNDDPDYSSAYHRRHPLVADHLGVSAWCIRGDQRREMVCVPVKHRDAQIDYALYFAEGDELRPGQAASVAYTYAVSDRQWGQWYQRRVHDGTDRLSIAAHLPSELEPECWGMTSRPSRTGLEPLPHVVSRIEGGATVYAWDRIADEEDFQQMRRVRLDWFFWRRILEPSEGLAASDVMAQFGILQVRHPMRGRRLPSHVPAGVRVRPIDLESATEKDLADRVLAHLRRVAGWVTRYHTFKPEVGVGIAAPQLGIAYRIAIVREPDSQRFIELVNPRVLAASEELADEYEGCLSFFDLRGIVRRPLRVTVAYDRLDGEAVTAEFTGAMARSVLHEIDHLNGKLYTDEDRMPAGTKPIFVDEYRAQRDAGG